MASRLAELAAQISAGALKIDDYLAANALPPPSFDEDGPVNLNLSADVEGARRAALDAMAELQALLQPPDQLLRPIVCSPFPFGVLECLIQGAFTGRTHRLTVS